MPSDEGQLTPLPQPGLGDYHCHCNYSVDAEGSIDDYCEAALQRELAEIGGVGRPEAVPEVSFQGSMELEMR